MTALLISLTLVVSFMVPFVIMGVSVFSNGMTRSDWKYIKGCWICSAVCLFLLLGY